jgi:hypothetical protein
VTELKKPYRTNDEPNPNGDFSEAHTITVITRHDGPIVLEDWRTLDQAEHIALRILRDGLFLRDHRTGHHAIFPPREIQRVDIDWHYSGKPEPPHEPRKTRRRKP